MEADFIQPLQRTKTMSSNGRYVLMMNKGNNKITELRAILQRESQNS
jgi:hypothetical protein